jgi:hypothetical protein
MWESGFHFSAHLSQLKFGNMLIRMTIRRFSLFQPEKIFALLFRVSFGQNCTYRTQSVINK